MLAVLRQRDFALLWAGGLISMLGDWLLFIALPFYIYDITGSALATGAMFIAETLPILLFGSIGGVFADRRAHVQVADPGNYVTGLQTGACGWAVFFDLTDQGTVG